MINIKPIKYSSNIIGKIPLKRSVGQFQAAPISSNNDLNKYSEASRFFGVDKRQNVLQKLENHIILALSKSKDSGILASFPSRAFFSVDHPKTIINAWNHIWATNKGRKFNELLTKPARLTFNSILFGDGGNAGSHTIGILYEPKSKTLFCMDSLSNRSMQVKMYQDILRKQIFNSPNGEIKKIIFSNKPQQNLQEFTCNNWTIANIEALQKAISDGKNIDTPEKLNDILPNNINAILQEQYEYVLKNSKCKNVIQSFVLNNYKRSDISK